MIVSWARGIRLFSLLLACLSTSNFVTNAAMGGSRLERLLLSDDRSATARIDTLRFYGEQLKSYIQKRDDRIRQMQDEQKGQDEIDNDPDIVMCKGAISMYNSLLLPKNQSAVVFARGLVGNNIAALEGVPISNFSDAFWHGLSIRMATALGDIFGDRVKAAADKIFGSAFDYLIETTVGYAKDVNSMLFHNSKDPFTPDELENWAELIVSCLEDFSKLIKGRMDFESRNSTMNARAFDSDGIAGDVCQEQVVWDGLIRGYAEQFDFFVSEIDRRIGYYKHDTIVVFYAGQLKMRMLEFKSIILSTKSLKDLSTKFGANSLLIIAIINNIQKLFKKLTVAVKPPSYSLSGRDAKRPSYLSSYADSSQKLYGSSGYGYGNRYAQGEFEPLPYDGWSGA